MVYICGAAPLFIIAGLTILLLMSDKKIKNRKIYSITILAICIILAIFMYRSIPLPTTHLVEGEIEVIFNENITFENATQIVKIYNCSIAEYEYVGNNTIRAEISVPIGEEEYYVNIFKNDDHVFTANLIYYQIS